MAVYAHALKSGRRVVSLVAAICLMTGLSVSADDTANASGSAARRFTNRLTESNDPYLLLHAHNPVDWYPWGAEAFAKAKAENKPIFLSIGYSTCYWCHVAERTIYSNPDIAKLMNQWFVNVKVDSEQRPDIDRIYMLARQIMTGGGGWPNNLFLTPDLKPFYAGSYFPPKDDPRAGPGFPTILAALHQAWTSDRAQALSVAENVMAAMRRVQTATAPNAVAPIAPASWLAKARNALLPEFDPFYGGLAHRQSGTKFPNAPRLALLFADYQANRTEASLASVLSTLDAIAFGGIHDQLGGGFHRYSTEPTWSIPHFEKMLYDNAQLQWLYAEAFRITGKLFYRQIAIETAQYLGRDMMSAEGGFYTARDAQLNGVEGEGYLWTHGEVAALLGENEAKRFFKVYDLTQMPRSDVPDIVHPRDVNEEPPAVLRIRVPVDQTMEEAGFRDIPEMLASFASDRGVLMAAREKRRQPARDEKIVVGLNGLAIAALAESGKLLEQPEFVAWARQAAERIWTLSYEPKTGALKHEMFLGKAQTDGFLSDYAALGTAFLSLADATNETIWRDRAATLADNMLQRFARPDGSFSTTPNEKDLLIPIGDEGDTQTPSGTSMAIDLLLRLHQIFDDGRYLDAAARSVGRMSGQFQDRPEAWATAVTALNRHPLPVTSTVEAAAPGAANTNDGFHVPATADHVRVSASSISGSDGDQIIVTIKVDDEYHINANPASFDFLIPTFLEFNGVKPENVQYPRPIRFTAKFAPEGLDVYEGSVAIIAKFPKSSLKEIKTIAATVTAQACTSQICLPPSKLPLTVSNAGQ